MEFQNYLLLLVGFIFGLLPRIAENRDRESRQRKRALTKLRRILEEIFISMEVSSALREAEGIQSIDGLFGLDESWAWRIPVAPPSASSDFGKVIDEILEWETTSGEYNLSRKVISFNERLENAKSLYELLSSLAKKELKTPERPINMYSTVLDNLKKTCSELLHEVDELRAPLHKRLLSRLKRQRNISRPPAA